MIMDDSSVWSQDARDLGPHIVTVICTVTATGTVFALARLYARGVVLGKLHADDYLIVASVVRRHLIQSPSPLFFPSPFSPSLPPPPPPSPERTRNGERKKNQS